MTHFVEQVERLAAELLQQWSMRSFVASPAEDQTSRLRRSIQAMPPRSLIEALAFAELGWAWTDGTGYSEWDERFLKSLQQQGRLLDFEAFLLQLRAPAHRCTALNSTTHQE